MLLLATLIALFAERLAPQLAERRSLAWFDAYYAALQGRTGAPGWAVLLILLAPWVVLTALAQFVFHGVL